MLCYIAEAFFAFSNEIELNQLACVVEDRGTFPESITITVKRYIAIVSRSRLSRATNI